MKYFTLRNEMLHTETWDVKTDTATRNSHCGVTHQVVEGTGGGRGGEAGGKEARGAEEEARELTSAHTTGGRVCAAGDAGQRKQDEHCRRGCGVGGSSRGGRWGRE